MKFGLKFFHYLELTLLILYDFKYFIHEGIVLQQNVKRGYSPHTQIPF